MVMSATGYERGVPTGDVTKWKTDAHGTKTTFKPDPEFSPMPNSTTTTSSAVCKIAFLNREDHLSRRHTGRKPLSMKRSDRFY